MPKIIKRQIQRSMPLLMILSLVMGTMATGLVFNAEISIDRVDGKWRLEVGSPKAEAQINDTATTSVTVRNAPPTFAVEAAESPASTSTSPVNVGGSIGFTATANDAESNRFYLLVCDRPGATAGAGGAAPACANPGVQFCVSADFAAGAEASCTYNNVSDPGAETDAWYAYVCDNHATEAACSDAYSQGDDPGSGDDSSPIHINHRPLFTAVNTTVNNQNPGGTFTVTASVTDGDVLGSPDQIWIYVCGGAGWTAGGGCTNSTLCSGTSTSPDVSCSFATTTPARDGNWQYTAYVKDWHDFAAIDNPRTGTYTVNNVAPTISSVGLHGGVNITVNMRGASEVAATTSATITDYNGYTDIDHATATIYWSGLGVNAYGCGADDDSCYPILQANCALGAVTGASSRLVSCNTTIAFNANPTNGSGGNYTWAATYWIGSVKGFDEALTGVGTSSALIEVNQTTALEVAETTIPYGSIRSGQNSGSTNATTTVWNYGNTPLNVDVIGEDMDRVLGGEYIAADQQRFSLTTFTYPGASTQLSSTTAELDFDIDAPKPTTASLNVSDPIYWGIAIPGGKLSGVYEGVNTLTAALDNLDW